MTATRPRAWTSFQIGAPPPRSVRIKATNGSPPVNMKTEPTHSSAGELKKPNEASCVENPPVATVVIA